MQSHYHREQAISAGVVGLVRDDARAREVSMQVHRCECGGKLCGDQPELGIRSGPGGDSKPPDFLRLTCHRTLSRRGGVFASLSRWQLEVVRADGTRQALYLVSAERGTRCGSIPWNPPELADYFDSNVAAWRNPARSGILACAC